MIPTTAKVVRITLFSYYEGRRAQLSECGNLLPLFNVPGCPAIFNWELETLNSEPKSGSKLPHSEGALRARKLISA
jgi:hypothetical protein